MKPYYEQDGIVIYHGDCREILPELGKIIPKIDLVLTDPPYGITACEWDITPNLEKLWVELRRMGRDNCAYVFTGSQPFTTDLINSNRAWFKYEWIWEKDNSSNFMLLKKQPGKRHENILVFCNQQPTYNPQMKEGNKSHSTGNNIGKVQDKREYIGIKNFVIRKVAKTIFKYPISVIKFNACGRGLASHPTQKPVALMEYLVKTYTDEGDTILDPFLGSGTTTVAAKRLNRRCIGIEIEEKYCEIAAKRCQQQVMSLDIPIKTIADKQQSMI